VHAIDRQVPTDQGKQLLWKVKQALNLAGLKPEDLWEDYVQAGHPAFPVLTLRESVNLDEMHPALAAVVLAKALELQSQLYPMRQYVWEIIKAERASETALREASLSSIAICVLELAARPSLDNRSDYILLAAVS
jgi:hypothetical protein